MSDIDCIPRIIILNANQTNINTKFNEFKLKNKIKKKNMAKKVQVDQELCIGCGACVNLCPEVFELQDDGKSRVIIKNGCKKCDYEIAINSCPVGAIKVED